MRQSEQPSDCLLPGTLGPAWAYVLNSDCPHRGLSSASTKKELGSVLFSILRDVEVRYVSLKAKLSEGAALSELPPLSIESTLLSAFSEFVSKVCTRARVTRGLHCHGSSSKLTDSLSHSSLAS